MKKIIILLLIGAAAYWGYINYGSTLFRTGAFDDQGKPKVILFTMDGCPPCADVVANLRSRNVTFEEVNTTTDEGKRRVEKFGVMQVPLTVIGSRKVIGNDLLSIESALAEAYGMDALTPAVRQVMRNHFDEQGKPRVIMYGVNTCPYCKRMKAYLDERKIAYQFVDVSDFGSGKSAYEALSGRGYPLIFVGYRRIDGYNEDTVNQAVKELL
jgi:glutaredoxin